MTTNYERFFSSPERAAESMVRNSGFEKAWNAWADDEGSLICSLVPPRSNGKAKAQVVAFLAFLEGEVSA